MTSSLVGSEMCIRDRTKPPTQRPTSQRRTPWSLDYGSSSRRERPDERPVSYTHLTLPTICSV
eukprot:1649787-Prorocentrum_lima.AAC.1